MSTKLMLELLIISILFLVYVYSKVKKQKLSIKYSFLWIVMALLMIIASIFPNFIQKIANLIGIETASNLIFLLAIGMLLIISFALTTILSVQKKKIAILTQELGILQERVRK